LDLLVLTIDSLLGL